MWLISHRGAVLPVLALFAQLAHSLLPELNLQCQSPMDYAPAPAASSVLDFTELSQRRASSLLLVQRQARTSAAPSPSPPPVFQHRECGCERDWAGAFCTRLEHYAQVADERAPTVCVCRQVLRSALQPGRCSQFLARCFPESDPAPSAGHRHLRRQRDYPNVYAKGDAVERGADGVLRRAWPQPQEGATPPPSPRRVANKSHQQPHPTAAVSLRNNNSINARCRCCFNQPDEYCNQLECRDMRPNFGGAAADAPMGAAADAGSGVTCACFRRGDYPPEICARRRAAVSAAGVQARDVFPAGEVSRLKGGSNEEDYWRARATPMNYVVAQRPFDRSATMGFFRRDGELDGDTDAARQLVRVDVAVLAALLSSSLAVLLAGGCYLAVRRFRAVSTHEDAARSPARRPSAGTAQFRRGNVELCEAQPPSRQSTLPVEERIHMV